MSGRPKRSKIDRADTTSSSRGRRILIADDSPDNRAMYAEYLTFKGYVVSEAKDGYEVVALAAALMPDLILMDLSMPGLDGWEATRELKSAPETRKIKIIALTGHAFSHIERRAQAVGCDRYVTKPCLPHEIAAIIAALLDG
jgi:CheY-like chemotaxis protein